MITIILSVLGSLLAGTTMSLSASEITNIVGKRGAAKYRALANDLAAIINSNSQLLSDFKSASADKRASILQSLIYSSGMGPRAESLRKEYAQALADEQKVTDDVTQRNTEAQNKYNEAMSRVEESKTSLAAGVNAMVQDHGVEPESYRVQVPSIQNVQGGLNNNA